MVDVVSVIKQSRIALKTSIKVQNEQYSNFKVTTRPAQKFSDVNHVLTVK